MIVIQIHVCVLTVDTAEIIIIIPLIGLGVILTVLTVLDENGLMCIRCMVF